jgi:hypothetical protein
MPMTRRGTFLLLLGVVLGCSDQDTDRLSRVGRKMAEKGRTLSMQGMAPLRQGWPVLRVGSEAGAGAVEHNVRVRLDTDALLDGVNLTVSVVEERVQLSGQVVTLAQRRRAVDLAQTTVGVTAPIIDKIEEQRR